MQLKLIVIRTGDMRKLVEFYSALGLIFEYHKHGNSSFHYSAKAGETVIEIYPLAKGQPFADEHLRLGFTIANFDVVTVLLIGSIISAPAETEWGYMAVVKDPDGRKIEIYKK